MKETFSHWVIISLALRESFSKKSLFILAKSHIQLKSHKQVLFQDVKKTKMMSEVLVMSNKVCKWGKKNSLLKFLEIRIMS